MSAAFFAAFLRPFVELLWEKATAKRRERKRLEQQAKTLAAAKAHYATIIPYRKSEPQRLLEHLPSGNGS